MTRSRALLSPVSLSSAARLVVAAAALSFVPYAACAQSTIGVDASHQATPVKDSSMLKPPAGHKVAVIEWTDLECPACAHAFPMVHAAIEESHVPLVHYDFIIPGHIWSPTAALYARYFEDKVSPVVSTDYRRQVFAAQFRIASQDDLKQFTTQFAASHHLALPFVIDPTGELRRKIEADSALGERMGLQHTPTIFVVTAHHYIDVADATYIEEAIKQAEAIAAKESGSASVTHHATATHK